MPRTAPYLMHQPKDKHDTVVWFVHRARSGNLRGCASLNGTVVSRGAPTTDREQAIEDAKDLADFIRSGLDFVRED